MVEVGHQLFRVRESWESSTGVVAYGLSGDAEGAVADGGGQWHHLQGAQPVCLEAAKPLYLWDAGGVQVPPLGPCRHKFAVCVQDITGSLNLQDMGSRQNPHLNTLYTPMTPFPRLSMHVAVDRGVVLHGGQCSIFRFGPVSSEFRGWPNVGILSGVVYHLRHVYKEAGARGYQTIRAPLKH